MYLKNNNYNKLQEKTIKIIIIIMNSKNKYFKLMELLMDNLNYNNNGMVINYNNLNKMLYIIIFSLKKLILNKFYHLYKDLLR